MRSMLMRACSTNVTVVDTKTFKNLQVNVVDAVLDTPGKLADALDFYNLTTLNSLLKATQTTVGDKQVSLFDLLNTQARGFTLFAPTDAAFTAAQSTLTPLQSNATAVLAVLGNHVRLR